ncbi:G10 protein-domain-containing protein [Baffinella frigidus]|nr:G10 protein-domain-containing protein [Cryptophyta sp. CCMP2293]
MLENRMKDAGNEWDIIFPTLEMFENRMKDAVNESHEGKRKHETTWPIHRIHYEKSRYVYELFHKKKEISRELLDFCIRERVVDGNLMAKWKKPGYEFLCSLAAINKGSTDFGTTSFLCSLAAINKGSTNFGTTSVCRVPLRLRSGKIAPNVTTGCISCASCDKGAPIWWNSKLPDPKGSGGGKRAAPAAPSVEDEEIERRAAMLPALTTRPDHAAPSAEDEEIERRAAMLRGDVLAPAEKKARTSEEGGASGGVAGDWRGVAPAANKARVKEGAGGLSGPR